MALLKMDLSFNQSGHACFVTWWIAAALVFSSCYVCECQRKVEEKELKGLLGCVDNYRTALMEMCKLVTGPEVLKEVKGLSVVVRNSQISSLLHEVTTNMEKLLKEKEEAVEALKNASEKAMKGYGPYKEFIDFKDVRYINAKEVIIEKDFDSMDSSSRKDIQGVINYLPTEPTWDFKAPGMEPMLNRNMSSIHVPTNIYDKSVTILNSVEWTSNLTDQFIINSKRYPSLTWQYFCSSDGIFRVYPGMQWPRQADKVDTFDCRIRRWYIQAASYPKNIVILLDSSGSMKGLRFAIARSTVNKILETLTDEDYFNVIQFSDEPRYVDECFNDTLMTASVDNIKRMQKKIDTLEAAKFSNFEKALTKAFKLFEKEQEEFKDHRLCNKAIMIVTDGAPDNFDSVFEKFNWPEKKIRVFTFLIGKEVPDNRQTRWMACVNKGKFTHISTRADVQENVQKYIKVLSRPLALMKAKHKVWSPVYIDYVTEQSDIRVPSSRPADLHMDFEKETGYEYEGLGLVMSLSMPVFDERAEVGLDEEDPELNLLGVAGTDLRINDLMKFIPTFQLGVNGYAFGVTTHGYILFHPDYRPFYSEKRDKITQHLRVKPKYNSVELSQLERTVHTGPSWNKENPLRSFLLMGKAGGYNISVLTHIDGMKRFKERQNHYHFKEVAGTFKLVFVVPKGYGTRYIQVDPKSVLSVAELNKMENVTNTGADLANWIYCLDEKNFTWTHMNIHIMKDLGDGMMGGKCKEYMLRLFKDWELTLKYAKVWDERLEKMIKSNRDQIFLKGLGRIWIGTGSGLTRSLNIDAGDMDWSVTDTQTIKSLYYRRAVDGWEDGYKYVFAGPVVANLRDFNFNTSVITMSTAEILGTANSTPVPAAVVAFNMRYSAFYEIFSQHIISCTDIACSCNDTINFTCYIIDNNGYILATNSPGRNGTGLFLGQHNGRLMRALLDDNIYKQMNLTDFQNICHSPVSGEHESSSHFMKNPFRVISSFFFWLISEFVLFLSQWNIMSLIKSSSAYRFGAGDECQGWIPEEVVRYLCGFVIDASTGHKVFVLSVTSTHSCVQNISRYTLNLSALVNKRVRDMPDCSTQCASKNKLFYEAVWLNDTNLVFVVMDASCICNDSQAMISESSTDSQGSQTSRYEFPMNAAEVNYDDNTQCKHLRNFSDELKFVDNTRVPDSFCLDSSDENGTVCGKSPALIYSSSTSAVPVLLTALFLFKTFDGH